MLLFRPVANWITSVSLFLHVRNRCCDTSSGCDCDVGSIGSYKCRRVDASPLTCSDSGYVMGAHVRLRTQTHLTYLDLAESDGGLMAVSVSGWADLKRP